MRLEPQLDPEPEHLGETPLFIAPHGRDSRDIADILVRPETLQTPDQFAVLPNLQTFIEAADVQKLLFPATNDA